MRKTSSLHVALASALALASANAPASAQQKSLTNLGTLSCTTGDAERGSKADAILSCSFRGTSGMEGDFAGRIVRKGPADLPGGKRVLVWSVFSAKADTKLIDIEGEYTGITGGARAHALVGGADGAIQLQPLTATAPDGPAPSLLELRFKPTKA
jgi:hypothetical protein